MTGMPVDDYDDMMLCAVPILSLHLHELPCFRGLFSPYQEDAANSFVPTVTAVSTSPDLRWMVQPTVNTSVSPPSGRAKNRSRGAAHASSSISTTAGANKAKTSSRKGQRSQVCKQNYNQSNKQSINQSISQSINSSIHPCIHVTSSVY